MSKEMKRNLIGGAGITALLTLFMTLALWPVWSRGANVSSPVREIVLDAREATFGADNPTLRLEPGKRVRFVVRNTDPGVLHSITLPGIDDQVRHVRWGEEIAFEVTIPEQGKFQYVCPLHAPRMQGQIVVAR